MKSLKWKKYGLIFEPSKYRQTRRWLHSYAQAPSTLVLEDRLRVYFSCRPPIASDGTFVSYTSFVDLDRADLTKVIDVAEKPILPLGNLGCFDEFGIYPFSCIETADKRLLGYYAGWTRCKSVPFNTAIGCAESLDGGRTFERLGQGPVIPYSLHEPFIMSGPKIRLFNNKFHLFYIAGRKWIDSNGKKEPVYVIRSATSDDGMSWTKLNQNLITPKLEENECQASPDVLFSNGKYHMFFCYRKSENYYQSASAYRIGYASSRNCIDWERNDSYAGVTISSDGFDSEMVSYPHVFELDGAVYMLYLGNYFGREGFGMAKLEGSL
jgi:hypothetical protein